MTTAQKKAIELVNKCKYLYNDDETLYLYASPNIAKKYALILVKEIIQETRSKYWYNVKHEIEKL